MCILINMNKLTEEKLKELNGYIAKIRDELSFVDNHLLNCLSSEEGHTVASVIITKILKPFFSLCTIGE